MAGGVTSGGSAASDTYAEAKHWLLLPSWLVVGIFVLAPVLMMFRKPETVSLPPAVTML